MYMYSHKVNSQIPGHAHVILVQAFCKSWQYLVGTYNHESSSHMQSGDSRWRQRFDSVQAEDRRSESGAPRGERERGTGCPSNYLSSGHSRLVPTKVGGNRLHGSLLRCRDYVHLIREGEARCSEFHSPTACRLVFETLADAVWKRPTPPTSRVKKLPLQRADLHGKGGFLTQSTWLCCFHCFSEWYK
jgi:hypothetical protein